jgi:hypothetical protein
VTGEKTVDSTAVHLAYQ